MSLCGRCHDAAYCSPACQKDAWRARHRHECIFAAWPPLEPRAPKRLMQSFASEAPRFPSFNSSLLVDAASGARWYCEHRREWCVLCAQDQRDLNLVTRFPGVPKADVLAWLEARKVCEEEDMLRAFLAIQAACGSSVPRSAFITTVGGREMLSMHLRSNALIDHVTDAMWAAPATTKLVAAPE